MARTFSEWLARRLDEGMTLFIQDYDRPASLHRLGDLASQLDARVGRPMEAKLPAEAREAAVGQRPGYDIFAADDLKDDERDGVINFYCGGWPREAVARAVSGAKYFLDEMGVKYGPFREETWRDKFGAERERHQEWGDDEDDPENTDPEWTPRTWQQKYSDWLGRHSDMDPAGVRVVRIPVLSNANRRAEQPPEVSLTNDNAMAIFGRVLGLPGGSDGFHDIDVRELIMRIESYMGRGDLDRGVREPAAGLGDRGARFFDGGLDRDGVRERIGRILEFAKWARDRGYDRLYVA